MGDVKTYRRQPTYVGDVQTFGGIQTRGHSCMPSYPAKWVLPLEVINVVFREMLALTRLGHIVSSKKVTVHLQMKREHMHAFHLIA